MSPLPIISRQRALSQVGEIRCGGEKKTNAPGAKLDAFRLTSQHKEILEKAAELWGGDVQQWASPAGDAYQLYTTASSLPCMVIVGYSLNRQYELWEGATKCVRRCDGIEEQMSGGPCLCNAEGVDRCDTVTRLMVMLPETGTSLGWRLRSIGEIAADELDGAMMVAEKLAAGRAFVPAVLRLTHRRSVSGGQTKRWVTPVLDFNLGDFTQVALPPAAGEIAPGYTPVAALPGVTLEEGLGVVNGAASRTRSGRAPQPIGDVEDFSQVAAPEPEQSVIEADAGKATADQKKALNALYGQLSEAGAVTPEQLYAACATMRQVDVDEMATILDGRKQDGTLSFAKLRESLTKPEASSLIDRLGRYADNLEKEPAA